MEVTVTREVVTSTQASSRKTRHGAATPLDELVDAVLVDGGVPRHHGPGCRCSGRSGLLCGINLCRGLVGGVLADAEVIEICSCL